MGLPNNNDHHTLTTCVNPKRRQLLRYQRGIYKLAVNQMLNVIGSIQHCFIIHLEPFLTNVMLAKWSCINTCHKIYLSCTIRVIYKYWYKIVKQMTPNIWCLFLLNTILIWLITCELEKNRLFFKKKKNYFIFEKWCKYYFSNLI